MNIFMIFDDHELHALLSLGTRCALDIGKLKSGAGMKSVALVRFFKPVAFVYHIMKQLMI